MADATGQSSADARGRDGDLDFGALQEVVGFHVTLVSIVTTELFERHVGEPLGHLRRVVRRSTVDRRDRRTQLGGSGVLAQVAVRPGSHAFQHVLEVVVHAQHQYPGSRRLL